MTDENMNRYWISVNPLAWKIESIEDGGEIFYMTYNRKGNRRQIFGAPEEASPGDRVLFYESQPIQVIVAGGTIREGLHKGEREEYDEPTSGITIRCSRAMETMSRDQLTVVPSLEDASSIRSRAQGNLFPLTEDEFETILALKDPIEDGTSQDATNQLKTKLISSEVDIPIPDSLRSDDANRLRRETEALLWFGKHLIFTGPPDTGKAKLAKAICKPTTIHKQVDDYRFTTTTSEWTTFDTVGGYVPSTGDGGQELLFEPQFFLECFRRDRVVNKWLIIDEVNRSDIDRAFEQLFFVLSDDSAEFPYEHDRTVGPHLLSGSTADEELAEVIGDPSAFPVTPSWRLTATMNTYDRIPLYEMSYIFVHRFNFVRVGVPPFTIDDGVRASLLGPNGTDSYTAARPAGDESLRPVLTGIYPVAAVLWQRINEHRVIGSSTAYGIIRYLNSYDDAGGSRKDVLTPAVVSSVYPWLEGIEPEQQRQLIRPLTDQGVVTEDGSIALNLDKSLLQQKAASFLGIAFDDDA